MDVKIKFKYNQDRMRRPESRLVPPSFKSKILYVNLNLIRLECSLDVISLKMERHISHLTNLDYHHLTNRG